MGNSGDLRNKGASGLGSPPGAGRLGVRGTPRWLAIALAVAVFVPLLGTGWVVNRGRLATDALTRAGALIQQLHRQLAAGRAPQAAITLAALRSQTAAAVAQTRDQGWRLAGRTPGVGDDLTAVTTVAAVLDDLATHALPPLVATAGTVNPATLAPRGGRLELTALAAAAPALAGADEAVRRALARVEAIPTDGLLRRTRLSVAELRAGLRRAAATTGTVARSAALLPAMLGAGGERTYLVLFQNLAEVRATGGLPGAFVVVSANRGVLRIVDQGSAGGELKSFARPVLPVDPAMRALYTDRLATYPGDVNFTPHFPTAAALIREMYRRRAGREVDGVLATDPVALAYLLRATGPVNAPDGTRITAGNAVRTLLSDVYARTDSNSRQDRYFAAVARTVFDRLTRSPGNPRILLAELARAAGERRLLAWSAHPADRRLIAGTVLEGALPLRDGARPTVGVFLNDGSGAKLGYYLTRAAQVHWGCRRQGRQELALRVTLGSTAPREGLSRSVLGLGLAGDPYAVRTNVLVFSPAGGAVVRAWLDGRPIGLATGAERGRAVGMTTIHLAPGESRTLDVTLLPAAGTVAKPATADGPPAANLWVSPGTKPWDGHVRSPARC